MGKKLEIEIIGKNKKLVETLDDTENKADRTFSDIERKGGASFARLGQAAVVGVAAIGAAAVGAAVGLYKIGETFDDASDTIRTTTGATGAELAQLENDFKGVFASVPTDAESAATAVAQLNQALGLTGMPLQMVSSQMLELSRITDTDVATNIEAATGMLNNWGIASQDQSATLDQLFRITQETGIGFDQLSNDLSANGVQLRALGFDATESASLIGLLGKQGLSVSDVMPAFNRAMAEAAESGISAEQALSQTWESIASAPDSIAAAQTAVDVFGARAGPRFAELIRSGALSFEELAATVSAGGDTILGAGRDTRDFAEQFTVFKNRMMVLIAPLAEKVFGALGDAMEAVAPHVERLAVWFSQLGEVFKAEGFSGVVQRIGDQFQAVWPSIQTRLQDALTRVGNWIVTQGPVIAQKLVGWGAALAEWVLPQVPPLLQKLGTLLGEIGRWIFEVGLPELHHQLTTNWGPAFMTWLGDNYGPYLAQMGTLLAKLGAWIVTEAAPFLISKLVSWSMALLEWVHRDVIPAIPPKLWELAQAIGRWITNDAAPWLFLKAVELGDALVGWLATMPGKIANAAVGMWNGIPDAFRSAINVLIDMWNGLEFGIPGFDPPGPGSFPGFTLQTPQIARLADGGIVRHRPGGIIANIGEGRHDEAVIPLNGRNSVGGVTNNYEIHISTLDAAGSARAVKKILEDDARHGGTLKVRVA